MINFAEQCRQKWEDGGVEKVELPCVSIPQGDWVAYEEYMEALLIKAVSGEIGRLIVRFPPESTEDNRLHTHPKSDRRVTVLEGSGEFICYRNKKILHYPLHPGIRVWMPRGILHTFKSGNEGLVVESLHNPFIPFSDPHCLVYPKESFKLCSKNG